MQKLDSIAVRVTKEIRHMDSIDHDPEGQRILKIVIAACQESYNSAIPPDDGKTTHVTSAKDIQFTVPGVEGVKDAKIVQEAMRPYSGLCHICRPPSIHDPRGTYDHAAEPLRRTG